MALASIQCNTYADFKTAVSAFTGSGARIAYSPSVPQAAAYSNDSTRYVLYDPPPPASDAPSAAQFQADFPGSTVFTGVVYLNG